ACEKSHSDALISSHGNGRPNWLRLVFWVAMRMLPIGGSAQTTQLASSAIPYSTDNKCETPPASIPKGKQTEDQKKGPFVERIGDETVHPKMPVKIASISRPIIDAAI